MNKINLEAELKYFEKKCEEIGNGSDCNEMRFYLYKLLEYNTTEEIISFYNETKESTRIILDCFESICINSYDIDTLKAKLSVCMVDKLLEKRVIVSSKYT